MADHRPAAASDAPAALVERALAGEEGAFARIVRKHRDPMVRVGLVVTGDLAVADDAVAAAWPAAWGRLGRLREPERLEAWLCSIAAEEAVRLVRARARLADAGPVGATTGDEAATPERTGGGGLVALPTAALDPELAARVDDLPAADRALLALRLLAGLTPDELGRASGRAPDAALGRCHEMLEALAPGPESLDPAAAETRLGDRLRALVDVAVAPVDIDAVARGANVTRNDHRYRVISLVIAIVAAIVVIAVPYLGERRTLPLPSTPTASPAAPTETPSPSPTPEG